MKLFLYNVDDGDNVINKTLGVPYEMDIRLSNDIDVINLEIRLRNIAGVDFGDFNYAHIPDLKRYYFIDKLGRVSRTDNILYLSCDVLETYKIEILNSNARVKRNLKTGDYMAGNVDNNINTSVSKHLSDKSMPDNAGNNYIVTVMGD